MKHFNFFAYGYFRVKPNIGTDNVERPLHISFYKTDIVVYGTTELNPYQHYMPLEYNIENNLETIFNLQPLSNIADRGLWYYVINSSVAVDDDRKPHYKHTVLELCKSKNWKDLQELMYRLNISSKQQKYNTWFLNRCLTPTEKEIFQMIESI